MVLCGLLVVNFCFLVLEILAVVVMQEKDKKRTVIDIPYIIPGIDDKGDDGNSDD